MSDNVGSLPFTFRVHRQKGTDLYVVTNPPQGDGSREASNSCTNDSDVETRLALRDMRGHDEWNMLQIVEE